MKYQNLSQLKKNSGVYQLKFGEETYIGSSADLFKRIIAHGTTLRRNSHSNRNLQLAYNNVKQIQYRVLKYCEIDLLKKTEQYYVNIYKPTLNCRNNIAQSNVEYKNKKIRLV